jgi:hypothetical protein
MTVCYFLDFRFVQSRALDGVGHLFWGHKVLIFTSAHVLVFDPKLTHRHFVLFLSTSLSMLLLCISQLALSLIFRQ